MKRIALAVIALAVVGAFAYRFHLAGEKVVVESIADVQAREGVPVEVAPVVASSVEIWQTFSGTAEGVSQTQVASDVSEEVTAVTRQVGDRVGAGDVLVRLSKKKSVARVRQAAAAYENVQTEAQRLEALHKAGAVSKSQLDAVRTQLKIAQADMEAASAMVDITSPIAGVVVQRDVEVGDQVRPGMPLMVIADVSQAVVKLHVTDRDARRLKAGQRARLSEPGIEGIVQKVALSANAASRLVEVELRFDNRNDALIPGTLAIAEVLMARAQDVPVVPKRAVIQQADGASVWVVENDNTARRRQVVMGLVNTKVIEIRQGVRVGEQVVVTGANRLEGAPRVKIITAAGPAQGE